MLLLRSTAGRDGRDREERPGDGREVRMNDVAVIVVSTNEAHWLRACLTSVFDHQGACSLDVVVADNGSTDGTAALVSETFPEARVVRCVNRGFAHANNRAMETTNARSAIRSAVRSSSRVTTSRSPPMAAKP